MNYVTIATHACVAILAVFIAKIDKVILFALRFRAF